MIIRYEPALQECRDYGVCEWCGKTKPTVPHHLYGRGQGGGCRIDAPFALMALCWTCHGAHHEGQFPMSIDLKAKAAYRDGVTQHEMDKKMHLLLRTPKETFRGVRGRALQDVVAKPLGELQRWIEERTVIA